MKRIEKPEFRKTNTADELVAEERKQLLEQVFGVIYIIFIVIITLAVLMELKIEYQIDLFPGMNTPFDDWYRNTKDVFENGAPPAPEQ